MKLLISLACLFLALTAQAHEKGNGGGEYELEAVQFPDQQKLKETTNFLKDRISASKLPGAWKAVVSNELSYLFIFEAYKYVDRSIVSVNSGFQGFSAWTFSKPSADVFLTKDALLLTPEKFSALVLHEVFHHVLSEALSDDETFVDRIATSIVTGDLSAELLKALEVGVYVQDKRILSSQILHAWDLKKSGQFWGCTFAEESELLEPFCERTPKRFMSEEISDRLPENVWSIDVAELGMAMKRVFEGRFTSDQGLRIDTPELEDLLRSLSEELGYVIAPGPVTVGDYFRTRGAQPYPAD